MSGPQDDLGVKVCYSLGINCTESLLKHTEKNAILTVNVKWVRYSTLLTNNIGIYIDNK